MASFDEEKWALMDSAASPRAYLEELCELGRKHHPSPTWDNVKATVRELPLEEDAAKGAEWIGKALKLIPAKKQRKYNGLSFKCFEARNHDHCLDLCACIYDPEEDEECCGDDCFYPIPHEESWASPVMKALWDLPQSDLSAVAQLREEYAEMVIRQACRDLPSELWLGRQHPYRFVFFGVTGCVEIAGAAVPGGYESLGTSGFEDIIDWIDDLDERYADEEED